MSRPGHAQLDDDAPGISWVDDTDMMSGGIPHEQSTSSPAAPDDLRRVADTEIAGCKKIDEKGSRKY